MYMLIYICQIVTSETIMQNIYLDVLNPVFFTKSKHHSFRVRKLFTIF